MIAKWMEWLSKFWNQIAGRRGVKVESELNFKEYLPREDGTRAFVFHCPGCGWDHCYLVGGPAGASPRWIFNGSMDKPTFDPSLLMYGDQRCHLYLRDGQIQFLADCWHPLAGKTVNMHTSQEETPLPKETQKDMAAIMAQQTFRPASAGRPGPKIFSAVLYHGTDGERLVKSKEEYDALEAAGWRDTPAAFGKTPAVAALPHCSGPIVTMNKGRTYICMRCGERMSSASPESVRMAHEKTETLDRTPEDYVDPDAVPNPVVAQGGETSETKPEEAAEATSTEAATTDTKEKPANGKKSKKG